MKKNKFCKMIAIGLATITMLVCMGCASDADNHSVEEKQKETATSVFYERTDKEEKDEDVSKPTAEMPINSPESQEASLMISIEDAIAIAEDSMKAMKEKDAEGILKYTNIEAMYRMVNDIDEADEKIADEITTIILESVDGYGNLGIVDHFATLENVEFYDVQLCSMDKINELNEFTTDTAFGKNINDVNYSIENAYRLKMNYNGIEEETVEEGEEPYILVLYANGQWEMDIYISTIKDLYDAIIENNNGEVTE